MTRWSNSEKNVGALSAKWPKNAEDAPSYWRALHDTIDGVRAVMGMLDDQFEMIDQVSDLSPSGRAKRRAEKAASALAEIDENYAPLAKAANLVERRVAKVRENVTLLPGSTTPTGVDIALAAEIRPFAVRTYSARGGLIEWRVPLDDARPLTDLNTMLAFIRGTTTKGGLRVDADLDKEIYQKGRKVTNRQLRELAVSPHETCPSWNYTITPR